MIIIAFIGLDGSGKTTQATRFVGRRIAGGIKATYDHQFRFNSNRVMGIKARLRPLLLRAQAAICEKGTVMLAPNAQSASPRSKFQRVFHKVFLMPFVVFVVLFLGWYRTRKKLLRSRGLNMLILDRYFYDELVRVEWKLGIQLPFRSFWVRLISKPHLVIYFDIPGDISWQRMDPQDSSLEAMRRKELVYKEWLPYIGKHTQLYRISILGLNIDEIQKQVENAYALEMKAFKSQDGRT